MIIFLNLTFFMLVVFYNFFSNSSLNKRLEKLNFFKNKTNFFSFKTFVKLYPFYKNKFYKSSFNNFHSINYSYYLFSNFVNNWFLIELFISKPTFKNLRNFLFIKPKLNSFLKLNKTSFITFLKTFKSNYLSLYKPSTFVKYVTNNSINILFLRKNKIFNKGRYSRNRQLYRTGVYWCIWLSVFLGYCLYFSFYRFTLNFGYQWWLIFSFLFLFVNQKTLKYHLYNLKIIYSELKKNFNWVSIFTYNLISFFKKN